MKKNFSSEKLVLQCHKDSKWEGTLQGSTYPIAQQRCGVLIWSHASIVQCETELMGIVYIFENPVVTQSTKLNVSAGLQDMTEPKEVGSNISEGRNLPERESKQAKSKHSFLPHFLHKLPQEGMSQI